MWSFLHCLLCSTLIFGLAQAQAQNAQVYGTLKDDASGEALAGATVLWVETGDGTATDEDGNFSINKPAEASSLRFQMIGYASKTFTIHQPGEMNISLALDAALLESVTVAAEQQAGRMLDPVNLVTISQAELTRAACCNLSESFETTTDVDVEYSDAVSGAKQIRMLGLEGRYVQLLTEGRPGIRGMALPFGLSYIPGTWMRAIQVTKGPGSVVNGYEAISGQVNVEYHQPCSMDKWSGNLYGNIAGRMEGNMHGSARISETTSTGWFAHGHLTQLENDRNDDGFLDVPTGNMLVLMNRWKFVGQGPWRGQFGFEAIRQDLYGGQIGARAEDDPSALYDYHSRVNRGRAFAKLGYVSQKHPGRSTGIMLQGTWHEQDALYGQRYAFAGRQRSAYANVVSDWPMARVEHRLRVGASLVVDELRSDLTRQPDTELARTTVTQRTEIVPGAFAEYTYDDSRWALIAGLRGDYHNLLPAGVFVTPRLHLRRNWNERTTIRISGGSGFRTVNPVVEFSPWLNTARDFRYPTDGTLLVERGYSAGTGFVQALTLFGRDGQLRADYYWTGFTDRVVADLDTDPSAVIVRQAQGNSRSHAGQIALDQEIANGLQLRLAGKVEDVRVQTAGQLRRETFVPAWRGLASLGWTSNDENWAIDATLQVVGPARLPLAYEDDNSPVYPLVLAQVSRKFGVWRVYAGTENATNFRQPDPIRGADNPFGDSFDAAGLWGPVLGRNVYAGVTFAIPH